VLLSVSHCCAYTRPFSIASLLSACLCSLLLLQVSVGAWKQREDAIAAHDKALVSIHGAGAQTHVSHMQYVQHRHMRSKLLTCSSTANSHGSMDRVH
jgi:hypothetical protein